MSRSNPHVNAPNPATCWFEWDAQRGGIRYYDKTAKKNVEVENFTFLLLDQLGSVRGWHEASKSGIYSNEVRDTRQEAMIVKSFKGGTLIEGIYQHIKDRVHTLGGAFNANCYIAVADDEPNDQQWHIASLRFKGAALGAWMEFTKAHRSDIYDQAIAITGYTEAKKGRITYRMPTFELEDINKATQSIAIALDAELQKFLTAYLARNTHEQAEPPDDLDDDGSQERAPLTDEDIPFAWMLPFVLPALAVLGGLLS